MFALWESMFCMICFVVVVLIPFATFYYESDATDLSKEGNRKSRCLPALMYESAVLFVFLLILLALYFTKSGTEIPVHEMVYPLDTLERVAYNDGAPGLAYSFIEQSIPSSAFTQPYVEQAAYISYPVAFPVYLIGLFGWLGWWLFAIFVGVGLASMPFDLIVAYIYRPHTMAPDEMASVELELQDRTAEILEVTQMLKRDRNSSGDGPRGKNELRKRFVSDRMEVNRLAQMVFLLERDLEEYRACKSVNVAYNPLVPYFKLAMGIFFAIVSTLWLLQIILAILTKPVVSPFLSLYLISFDLWFPMFGNLTYAGFSLYLLVCTVKGCFKISVRFLCIKIHPMQVGGTYVNSFLFNLGIILLCTIPLIHFCVLAFAGYAVNTDIFLLFGVQVNYLHFYSQFYTNDVFIWIILLAACSVLPYFFMRPRDVAVSTEDFKKNLQNKAAGGSKGIIYSPISRKERADKGKGRDKGDGKDIEMGATRFFGKKKG